MVAALVRLSAPVHDLVRGVRAVEAITADLTDVPLS
jgi:hypothetical protein